MRCSGSWKADREGTFASSVARLFGQLELQGCQLEEIGASSHLVWLPGPDRLLLGADALSATTLAQHAGLRAPFEVLRHFFWDRAILQVEREHAQLLCRWIYWSPFQVLAHATILAVSAGAVISGAAESREGLARLLLLLFANALPVAVSMRESGRLRRALVAAGFRPRA